MKLGILKTALLENSISKIHIHCSLYAKPLIVDSAVFDSRTRKILYLNAADTVSPRTSNVQTIKSYILDFMDVHEVLVKNMTKNSIYRLQTNFEVDKNNEILNLHIDI